MTRRVVITGVSGQAGGALVRHGLPGLEVVGATRADLDLSSPASLRERLDRSRPDILVNCAAYTAVDKAESEPDLAALVNAEAPGVLATWCADHSVPMVHVSTDYVFDGSRRRPWRPDDPTAPLGVYGTTKEQGELAVRAAGGDHAIVRTAWLYDGAGRNFLTTMLRLGTQSSLGVVDDQTGCPTAADDLARGLAAVVEQLAEGNAAVQGTHHFCASGETTWYGFAEAIFEFAAPVWGHRPEVRAITTADYPTPAKRPAYSVLDCGSFIAATGVEPRPWRSALRAVLDGIDIAPWGRGDAS